MIPMGRAGTPEEIAESVLFLSIGCILLHDRHEPARRRRALTQYVPNMPCFPPRETYDPARRAVRPEIKKRAAV